MKPDWKKMGGLLPAVVQDDAGGKVLMVGYMDAAALAKTRRTGKVTFFSRSKARLWTKGESSGNFLRLRSVALDCDGDALLVRAVAEGPTCHTGAASCFDSPLDFLADLDAVIVDRLKRRPRGSYTTSLLKEGLDRVAQKVGEEAVETVIASKNRDRVALVGEAADLIFHLMLLLRARGTSLGETAALLRARHKR
ncbi:MAG TPA: bifunctional phosphoribosyl-AMP cyclohydrolase/phosphoribosyl-ATP diphosphatase HisIE [Elusimicrobiota bacterium]|jgi:phosphoribosyl-ATP pyrophosphohydrolase/phosphoribosyl-AMP cyclohydrolase|nr:bifunctional phosphoribosyl-AMP cyclohydrolase/phosphoribosyl-ATP diphosphatase HisIE [Elusimicrobiota bacterium]